MTIDDGSKSNSEFALVVLGMSCYMFLSQKVVDLCLRFQGLDGGSIS